MFSFLFLFFLEKETEAQNWPQTKFRSLSLGRRKQKRQAEQDQQKLPIQKAIPPWKDLKVITLDTFSTTNPSSNPNLILNQTL